MTMITPGMAIGQALDMADTIADWRDIPQSRVDEMTSDWRDCLLPMQSDAVWESLLIGLQTLNPATFIMALQQSGILQEWLPEVSNLFGVPQRAKYHPEIDTGIHILMCLEQAARLNASLPARLAVLFHDVGKGITNPEDWPAHVEHEHLGVPLVLGICHRYAVAPVLQSLLVMVCKYHLTCHRIRDIKAGTLRTKFDLWGVHTNPTSFNDFLIACEADARGRLGLEDRIYTETDYIRAAIAVDTQAIAVAPPTHLSDIAQDQWRIAHRVRQLTQFIKQDSSMSRLTNPKE